MNIKSATKKATTRLLKKEDKKFGIINYDEDNLYPQRMMLLTKSSPTAKDCLDIYGRFIEGGGFKDITFFKSVVNSDKQTMDKILRLVRKDLARFRGFCVHINVSLSGHIVEIFHVPFENVRFASPVKKAETGFSYAVYPDWNKQVSSSIKPDAIDWFHSVDLRTEIIAEQAEEAGGWDSYNGQLIYISMDEGTYPDASCDSVIESMFAEIQSDISTTNNIEENFTAKGMFVHKGKFADEEEKETFEDEIEEFIGAEGASIIVVDVDKDEDTPEFVQIPNTTNDKMYEYTDKKVIDKIIRNWLIPKILLSITDGGGFFNQEQIRDATAFYNDATSMERLVLEEAFTFIGKNFITKINKTEDYSIIPIEFKLNKNEPPQGAIELINNTAVPFAVKRKTLETFFGIDAETAIQLVPEPEEGKRTVLDMIGVAGVQAMTAILSNEALTAKQKQNTLIIVFGLTEEDAAVLSDVIAIQTV